MFLENYFVVFHLQPDSIHPVIIPVLYIYPLNFLHSFGCFYAILVYLLPMLELKFCDNPKSLLKYMGIPPSELWFLFNFTHCCILCLLRMICIFKILQAYPICGSILPTHTYLPSMDCALLSHCSKLNCEGPLTLGNHIL